MSDPRPLALVTGASSGIGAATARALSAAGFDLFLVARRADRLRELARSLESRGRVDWQALDVRSGFASAEALPGLDRVRVLVNNAGLAKGVAGVQDGDPRDWDEMIDTNIKGLLGLTRAVLPHMVRAGRGHVVNVGSVAGRWVYPGGAVYCATKFAVRALSEGLRLDLSGTGVRVTNVEPGMVETEFSQVRFGNGERAKAVYKGMTPLKAEDVAESIVWCVTRPPQVNVQELVLYPTDQASPTTVHRR